MAKKKKEKIKEEVEVLVEEVVEVKETEAPSKPIKRRG